MNSWSSSLPALTGVLLGVIGSLVGQQLPTKAARDAAGAARIQALRDERKSALLAFLAAVQPAEQTIEERFAGTDSAVPERNQLRHALWMAQKPLDLIASANLAAATHKYAERLSIALENGIPENETPWTYLHPVRDEFLAAAKDELSTDRTRR